MSRNALDRMKAQGKAKSKENRTKRREEDMKRYGRNGYSASDKAYINGNYANNPNYITSNAESINPMIIYNLQQLMSEELIKRDEFLY